MANLPELDEFTAGVFQIEEDTVWLGGAEGPANDQGKALANRTKWLKGQLEALGAAAVLIANLASQAEAEAGADNTKWMTPLRVAEAIAAATGSVAALDADADGTLAANSDLRVATQKATKTYIAAAVAALVNSSPAALDTLKELADALGDDANFAATMTNALALKAPLASPALTGNPTAPTPAQFDNDTSIATTAFARAIGHRAADYHNVTTSAAISATWIGSTLVCGSAGNIAPVLPAANAVQSGDRFEVFNINTGIATFTRAGADLITVGSSTATTVAVGGGDSLTLESNGADRWVAVGGSAQFGFASAFGSSLAASGYQKLPSGLIFQWGTGDCGAGSTATVTFPIAFTSAAYSVSATDGTGSGLGYLITTVGVTTTGCGFTAGGNAGQFYWFAVGK